MVDVCVIGSHRNEWLGDIVTELRRGGLEVFSLHESGFSWPDVGRNVAPAKKLSVYSETATTMTLQSVLHEMFSARLILGIEPLGVTGSLLLGYALARHSDNTYLYLTPGELTLGSLLFTNILVPPFDTLAGHLQEEIKRRLRGTK